MKHVNGKTLPPGDSAEAGLPPDVKASPVGIRLEPGGTIRWWRPGWRDAIGHVGYRWVYLTPAVALLGLWATSPLLPTVSGILFFASLKLGLVMIAVAVSLAGYVIRRAVQTRVEPFCIFCGYNLTGLPDHYRCPECGRPYTWALIDEYRRDPHWFIQRWKAQQKLPAADEPFEAGPVTRRQRARDGTE